MISVRPYPNSQVSFKPVGYQASSEIIAVKLIIMIMIITVMIIMIIIITICTILRKMSSLDGGSAPQFTTHQSCNPHKCQMKEVRSCLDTSFCSCKLTELFVQFLFVTTAIFLVSEWPWFEENSGHIWGQANVSDCSLQSLSLCFHVEDRMKSNIFLPSRA